MTAGTGPRQDWGDERDRDRRPERRPSLRRVAIALSALGALLVAVGAGFGIANIGTDLPEGTDWRVADAGGIALMAFGALLAIRLPGNAVSWVALSPASRTSPRRPPTSTPSTRC
jgi:cytochrome c biogenesis protein CcdA